MNIALVTFLYPKVESWIGELFDCIKNQTKIPDKVILFNDGVKNLDKYLTYLNLETEVINVNGSPFENRLKAINYIKSSGIDLVVFQDADDLMHNKRIEIVTHHLLKNDVVVNDISLMSKSGEILKNCIWKKRISNLKRIDYKFIYDKNVLGLGNTALRKEILENFNISISSEEIYAADWYIFYQLLYDLNEEISVVFTSETYTSYRQHDSNISTLEKNDLDSLKRALKVREAHYLALQETGYLSKNKDAERFLSQSNTNFKRQSSIESPFWWELE